MSSTSGWDIGSDAQRLAGWRPSLLPNDRLLRMGRDNARARSRELRRNSGYGERAVSALVAHLVGTGIRLQVQAVPSSRGRKASAASQSLAARVEELFEEWSTDPQQCDLFGDLSWQAQQATLMGCVIEHGEVLVRRRDGVNASGVNLRLQGIEPEWIADFLPDGGDLIDGIRYHMDGPQMGRPRSFELHKGDPNDPLTPVLGGGNSYQTDQVPASDIMLVKRVTSPGQRRGVPWLSAVAVSLHDLGLFRDATLKRQQIAAMLAVFVTDNQQGQVPSIGGVNRSSLFERDGNEIAQLQPATVTRLGHGEGIQVPQLPQVAGQEQWAEFVLREIASGLGLSYEALTGDLTGVNFSSARMGALEMGRNIDMLRESVIRCQLLLPVWRWWRMEAQGVLGSIPTKTIRPVWVPPRRHQVDPVKETQAQLLKVRHGLASLKELIAEDGRNPEDVIAGLVETGLELRQLGLTIPGVPGASPQPVRIPVPETSQQQDDEQQTPPSAPV